jgi:hypothetical protein
MIRLNTAIEFFFWVNRNYNSDAIDYNHSNYKARPLLFLFRGITIQKKHMNICILLLLLVAHLRAIGLT